ncbi:MAG: hypothetical protein IPL02_11770 [Moraxellaceae bacterium]|nr:hypothetical protein [Moraxellaceae bacterium]
MAFVCNDCGNKSTQKFLQGKCPACGSFSIKSTHKTTKQAIKEKEPKTLIEIVILILLWGLIGYGTWDKYLRPHPSVDATSKTVAPTEDKSKDIMEEF